MEEERERRERRKGEGGECAVRLGGGVQGRLTIWRHQRAGVVVTVALLRDWGGVCSRYVRHGMGAWGAAMGRVLLVIFHLVYTAVLQLVLVFTITQSILVHGFMLVEQTFVGREAHKPIVHCQWDVVDDVRGGGLIQCARIAAHRSAYCRSHRFLH